MLDCPEASQTSPTRMSVSVTVFLPRMTSDRGSALAASAGSSTRQRPAASAVVSTVWPAKITETFSPASATPQTGTGLSRWSTAWSANSVAGLTSARASAAAKRRQQRTNGFTTMAG